MAITCGWACFAIYAEQRWRWASRLSSCIIALLGALFLTNLGIIPVNCFFFDDIIWGYVVPMAIPILLIGTLGYVLGTYFGMLIGTLLGA